MRHSIGWQVRLQMFFSKYMTSPRLHGFFYRLTGGTVGSRLPGVDPAVLLLMAPGRKSGKQRVTPVVYFQFDDRIVIAATNNGDDRHPAWYWNLRSTARASVQIGRSTQEVRVFLAEASARDELWKLMTEKHPLFAAYQQRTTREIPVFILEPA